MAYWSLIIDQYAGIGSSALDGAIAGTAANPAMNVLGQSISSTQAQVQAIQNKLNELINAITRPAA